MAFLLALSLAVLIRPGPLLALKDLRIHLPVAARVGQPVRLSCQYDLEGSLLYSIKWYRNDSEFFSYVPKEQPATRLYPEQGIAVDLTQSDANNVTLLNVTRDLGGQYKCEVSADMPDFHTGIRAQYLHVFEPPSRKPQLTVDNTTDSLLRANCSTAPSFPRANITWFMDNRPHPSPGGVLGTVVRANHSGAQGDWSSSSLELAPAAKAPRSLRCQASIFDVWVMSSDETQLRGPGTHPQPAPVRGAASASGTLSSWGLTGPLLPLLPLLLHRLPR